MGSVSVRLNDDEYKLIHDYVKINNLNLSQFIREVVLDHIEDDLEMSKEFTERILAAKEEVRNGKVYTFEEARKELGI